MKLAEVTLNTQDQSVLFESLDANNNTEFATNDLVSIVNAHTANNWTTVSEDDFEVLLNKLCPNG
jgi:hypothetical protein